MEEQDKVPVPPIERQTSYKPISFWASVISILDRKVASMEQGKAYGEIGVTFKFHRGRINRILWNDEVSDLALVEEGGGTNNLIEELKKDVKR